MLNVGRILSAEAQDNIAPQDAKLMAQFIAMAPFVFQTAICMRDFGVLKALVEHEDGLDLEGLLSISKISKYSLEVLLDAAESSGILSVTDGVFRLTQVGSFLAKDPITNVNLSFSKDVCYQGLFRLKEALETNTPMGLKVFGGWSTLYEGLSKLPEKVKSSWFAFDHFYSDDCFPRVLPIVFKLQPKRILDVGGNTGKFAIACVNESPDVQVMIADHSGQIEIAKAFTQKNPAADRIHFFEANLKHDKLPQGFDVVWMSQLLSCFSEDEVVMLLHKGRSSLLPNGSLFVMETFTDNQKFKAARFCLDMTSLYFTAMANGNSRMYRSKDFYNLIGRAGLRIVDEHLNIRLNHTLLRCQV